MKISFFNRKLFKSYAAFISGISTVISLILIFIDIPDDSKIRWWMASAFLLFLIVIYFALWGYYSRKKSASIKINGTKIVIKEGDIFKSSGLKVIPFNEYFDTEISDKIISTQTLNGKYISRLSDKEVNDLNTKIASDERLKEKIRIVDSERKNGKKISYQLGSIFKNEDYLLLAFSMFDENNRAYLDKNSFWKCLINMWDEIDIIHGGYSINIPLLGTGMTRKHNLNLDEQELLELLILSFKMSGLKLNSHIQINILIYAPDIEKINFLEI